jgi:hypothetical protein
MALVFNRPCCPTAVLLYADGTILFRIPLAQRIGFIHMWASMTYFFQGNGVLHAEKGSGSLDTCPQRLHFGLDPLVPPVDLVDVLDDAFPCGAERGNEQGHACADVRTEERFAV